MDWLENLSPTTKALVQGQWISLLTAGTGIFATILSDTHPSTNFPLLMNSFNYLLLSTYLLRKYIRDYYHNRGEASLIKSEMVLGEVPESSTHFNGDSSTPQPQHHKNIMYWYILAAILDVEANYLVLEAYNYTTITSVMLLDCFTIPCAMLLSYLFLGCRYNYKHLLGTGICLLGLACIVINDSLREVDDDTGTGSNPLKGDILCLGAAVFYASSNVLQEHLVKFHDREEFLGYLGCFGFVLAAIQCMAVDLPAMKQARFTGKVVGAMCGFIICLFLMYTNTTAFLQQGDAVLFNLGLLTSDVYAVIFAYFFTGYLVDWLYFVAFALVIVGLIIYHTQPAPLHIGRDNGDIGLFYTIQRSVFWRRWLSGSGEYAEISHESTRSCCGSGGNTCEASPEHSGGISSPTTASNVQYNPLPAQESEYSNP